MKLDKSDSLKPNQSRFNFSGCRPSWLISTLADLDERMKIGASVNLEEDDNGDTFAERAESYYLKRPQLVTLLHDLYNAYLALADRYSQTLTKHHHHHRRHSSLVSSATFDGSLNQDFEEDDGVVSQLDSDIESSLSYQHPVVAQALNMDISTLVAELVMKNVDHDILAHEIGIMEKQRGESSRKIGLQKSLLDVLESERLVLLNENARLGYRVAALVEENKGLASESVFVKRKASELARCALKMREDHRVCMLSRQIEDMQAQIHGLEERNKYYEMLVKRDQEGYQKNNNKNSAVGLDMCFQVETLKMIEHNHQLKFDEYVSANDLKGGRCSRGGSGRKKQKWWKKFKKLELFQCMPHFSPPLMN